MKPIRHIAIKDAKGWHWPNGMQEEISALPPGRYDWQIEKHKKKKSLSQLGYYFAVVIPMFRDFALEQGWEFESMKRWIFILNHYLPIGKSPISIPEK